MITTVGAPSYSTSATLFIHASPTRSPTWRAAFVSGSWPTKFCFRCGPRFDPESQRSIRAARNANLFAKACQQASLTLLWPIASFDNQQGEITAVEASPTSRRAVSSAQLFLRKRGDAVIWDLLSGTVVGRLQVYLCAAVARFFRMEDTSRSAPAVERSTPRRLRIAWSFV
jgi:hypothetical protein